MDLSSFIGKNDEELEKALGFTHYVETKDSIMAREKDINPDIFVEILLKFAGNQKLNAVKEDNGTIMEITDISLNDAKNNLLLLQRDKGKLFDEDVSINYSILGENFYAHIHHILMFSASEKNMQKMVRILDEYSIKYHEPYELGKEQFFAPPPPPPPHPPTSPPTHPPTSPLTAPPASKTSLTRIRRNDPCYCGSGKKYKKCCINK